MDCNSNTIPITFILYYKLVLYDLDFGAKESIDYYFTMSSRYTILYLYYLFITLEVNHVFVNV